MAGYSADTVRVAAATEALVGDAVAGTHVVGLVPDVSIALSPGNVLRLQVIPLVRVNSYLMSFIFEILTAQTSNSPPVVGLKNMASGPRPVS